MGWWSETVTDLTAGAQVLRERRYGMIEVVEGQFSRVVLRPFPKLFVVSSALSWGMPGNRILSGDRCRLYYNQPQAMPNYLALKYIVSGRASTLATLRRVLDVLDEIGRIKRTDAIVCDAMNWKLSDRLMVRGGWEPHCPSRWHRHFIRRFYGTYPPATGWIAGLTTVGS